MKILYILPEFGLDVGGGIATFYRHLLPAIASLGNTIEVWVSSPHDVRVVSTEVSGVKVRCPSPDSISAARSCLGEYAVAPSLQIRLACAWAVWEESGRGDGFDLVETTDWGMLFAPWLASSDGPPVVVQLHASNGQVAAHDPDEGTAIYGLLARLLETVLLPGADELQTYGHPNQADWQDLLGVDVKHIWPAWSRDVVQEVPLPPVARDGEFGLCVGRVQNWKGVETLCRAMRRLGSKSPRILWVGKVSGGENGFAARIAMDYPDVWGRSVIQVGGLPRAETSRLQAAAKFVVVPSDWDVFNLSVVEAMGAGRAVVCSEGAGAAGLIEHGVSGFRFPSGDVEALSHTIASVCDMTSGERLDIGRRGKKVVMENLDPTRVALERSERYNAIFSKKTESKHMHPWRQRLFAAGGSDAASSLNQFSIREILRHATACITKKAKGLWR